MSDIALKTYKDAQLEQHNRNEARHILMRVNEARQSPHIAGIRWPFELLQNALDAGPRPGADTVTVALRQQDHTVVYEHDGKPFTSLELTALLSGGSSKEFESKETTGRFGTGFLVTHVLAKRTRIKGLLDIGSRCESFQLDLDRGGDDKAILENIIACDESIRLAAPVPSISEMPSAIFEYLLDTTESLSLGVRSFRDALPYLYGTRPRLGKVVIQVHNSESEEWTPGQITSEAIEGGIVYLRDICVRAKDGSVTKEMRVLRFALRSDAEAYSLILLCKDPFGWSVTIPEDDKPRVYREYPVRGSCFLPINLILDGKFGPDQERSRLMMGETDKRLVEESLSAGLLAVKKAIDEKWRNGHLLARVCSPKSAFDPNDVHEKEWWAGQLKSFASRLAALPIVDTTAGMLPATVDAEAYADFVVPRLSLKSPDDEITVGRLWSLVASATGLQPPRAELAVDWKQTALGWHGLGLNLNLVTVKKLALTIGRAHALSELEVVGDKREWLASFIDVVGECWKHSGAVDESIFVGLLPDQYGRLTHAGELKIDAGISEELKDICKSIGLDVRSSLLDSGLLGCSKTLQLAYLDSTLKSAVRATASETGIVEQCHLRFDEILPDGGKCNNADDGYMSASIRFLAYILRSQGKDAETVAKKSPFITSDEKTVRWSQERMLMAPVHYWRPSAQAFAEVYPPDRILNDAYAGTADGGPSIGERLVACGIAYADPISVNTPVELKDRRLWAIAQDKGEAKGVVISGVEFSQIALLPDLINRCAANEDFARDLLGLVLCHVAPTDQSWKLVREVTGKKSGSEVTLKTRGALWLADLTYRPWVPFPNKDGELTPALANAETLGRLLAHTESWLHKNDAATDLLGDCFGFDCLELGLIATEPNAEKRQTLRKEVAETIECVGSDPNAYKELREAEKGRRTRERDIARCRKFGLAIQDAIKMALEARGMEVTLVDRGYDFEVIPATDDFLTTAAYRIEVGRYLLEVKATTTGQARMTPMQANTARAEAKRYALCVVDLRGVSEDRLDHSWTAADMERLAVLVTDIGNHVAETCEYVDLARQSDVAITNEKALRYEVPLQIWQDGVSIKRWVESIGGRV